MFASIITPFSNAFAEVTLLDPRRGPRPPAKLILDVIDDAVGGAIELVGVVA